MSPEISAIIRVKHTRLEQSIDEALQRELSHVLSGNSDHEGGSTEALPGLPQGPSIPSMFDVNSSTQRSSGKKAADKLRRQNNRALRRTQCPSLPRFSNSKKYRDIDPITIDFNADRLTAAKGAFVSQRQHCDASHESTLNELVMRGFKVVEWDGRTPTAIVDQEDRIMTIMAGQPQGEGWGQVHGQMSTLLEKAGANVQGPHKERRGNFIALSTGISYGGGQTAPGNLAHRPANKALLDNLCHDTNVIRAAGFMSSCFAFYAPKLYSHYSQNIKALLERYAHLKKPFPASVFPACTFNCGPRVVTLEHVDTTNVPYGLCAIFACGSYDPTKGGHLILFNLCLVIQFPPGSTILVPSGTIRHGNVAIQPHETRQSFTQYCPGGLLRWVAYGFKAVKEVSTSLRQQFEETHEQRREHAVGLFSKLDQLYDDRVRIFGLRSDR